MRPPLRMQEDIIAKVKSAMERACETMLDFTDEPSMKFTAEYLLTVNVAQSISELNGAPADPYRVLLEKNAVGFAQDCLRPVRFRHPTPKSWTHRSRIPPKLVRRGRIDVAVYIDGANGYMGKQPLCAIEVKGFSPSRKCALDDLKRNLEFLRVTGTTGRSELAFTVFAALDSYERHQKESQISANEQRCEARYQRWLAELGNLDDIQVDVDSWTVRKETVGRLVDEGEYTTLDSNATHHFVGTIVCFSARRSDGEGALRENAPSSTRINSSVIS